MYVKCTIRTRGGSKNDTNRGAEPLDRVWRIPTLLTPTQAPNGRIMVFRSEGIDNSECGSVRPARSRVRRDSRFPPLNNDPDPVNNKTSARDR